MDLPELDSPNAAAAAAAAASARFLPALGVDVDVGPRVDGCEDDRGRAPRHGEDLDVRSGLSGGRGAHEHGEEDLETDYCALKLYMKKLHALLCEIIDL